MLLQERIAWVWIIASMVVFTTYFTTLWVMQQDSANLSFLTRISLLGVALITFAVVVGGDRAIAVLRGQGQTDDERDRLIRLQAVSVAYYVLMAGAIVRLRHAVLAQWLGYCARGGSCGCLERSRARRCCCTGISSWLPLTVV